MQNNKYLSRDKTQSLIDGLKVKKEEGQSFLQGLADKGYTIEGYNDKPKAETVKQDIGFTGRLKDSLSTRSEAINQGVKKGGMEGYFENQKGLYGMGADLLDNSAQALDEALTGGKVLPAIGEFIAPVLQPIMEQVNKYVPEGTMGRDALDAVANATGVAGALSGTGIAKNATAKGLSTVSTGIKAIPEITADVFTSSKNLRTKVQTYAGEKSVEPQFGTAAIRLTGSATRLDTPLMTYEKYYPQAEKAISDTKIDPPISMVGEQIGDNFKKVVDNRKAVGNVMGQELKKVGNLKTDIESVFVNFETALNEAGLTYNGLSKKMMASDLSKVAPDDVSLIEDFVGELNRIGSKPSIGQIDALISRVNDKITYSKSAKGMTSTTNGERMIKNTLTSLRGKFDEIPKLAKYSEARKTYAELSNFIDEGAGFLGKLTQSGDFAKDASIAKSAVQSILNNGKKDWLLKLEALTDYPALDEATLALQAMKDAGDFRGLSLLETMADGAIPTSKAGFTQKIIDYGIEKGKNIVTGSPADRTRAYLKSLEKSGNKVAPKNISTKTPTPKKGLINIPTNKGIIKSDAVIPKTIPQPIKKVKSENVDKFGIGTFTDLDGKVYPPEALGKLEKGELSYQPKQAINKGTNSLTTEAKKYKTAEEFVKAKEEFITDYANGRLSYRNEAGIIQYKKEFSSQEKDIIKIIKEVQNNRSIPNFKLFPNIKSQLEKIWKEANKK